MRLSFGSLRLAIVVAACLAAALSVDVGVAAATPSPHRTSTHRQPSKKPKTKTKTTSTVGPLHGKVPEWERAAFATFDRPRAKTVPGVIARRITNGPSDYQQQGLDYHEARRLDVANAHFYLVPGKKAVCLFLIDGGSACKTDPASLSTGLNLDIVPPPPGRVDTTKAPITPGPVVTFGIAPRGVTKVTLNSEGGETVVATQAGEAYAGMAKTLIVSRTFTGPNGDVTF